MEKAEHTSGVVLASRPSLQRKISRVEEYVSSMESSEQKLYEWQDRLKKKEKELEQREASLMNKHAKYSAKKARLRRKKRELKQRAAWLDQQHVLPPLPLSKIVFTGLFKISVVI